jgi:hypothetical protein
MTDKVQAAARVAVATAEMRELTGQPGGAA